MVQTRANDRMGAAGESLRRRGRGVAGTALLVALLASGCGDSGPAAGGSAGSNGGSGGSGTKGGRGGADAGAGGAGGTASASDAGGLDAGAGSGPGDVDGSAAGDGSAGGAGGGNPTGVNDGGAPDLPPPIPSPWTELSDRTVSVRGGSAISAGGRGQAGGAVLLQSKLDIVLDPARTPTAAPPVPAAGGAIAIPASALGADVTYPAGARIADVATSGSDGTRTITVNGGDLLVEGTLRAGDLGNKRQALTLSDPGGTIYVTGTVDTSGSEGTDEAGGAIAISARRVVITGHLVSSGGNGSTAGGAAGAINVKAAETLFVTGGVDAMGGNARDPGAVVGGQAADVTLQAGGNLVLSGVIRLRGGAATSLGAGAQGGAAAVLRVGSDAAVEIGAVIDARGGVATAATAGGVVAGGAAGGLRVGEGASSPASITVLGPIQATGGDGDTIGGKGGTFTAAPDTGNATVAGLGAIDVAGGSAMTTPGQGGQVSISARTEDSSGGVTVSGEISAAGGSVRAGGNGPGGAAGRIDFQLISTLGAIDVLPSGKLLAVGGRSGGAGVAGGGGHIFLFTKDGDLTVAGTIGVMGGDAPDPGGTGGLGGFVNLFSDNNFNGDVSSLGNLLVTKTGLVDASGGAGSIGGSARNDGIAGQVAIFPDAKERIAILFNCDGVHGETINWMENEGRMVARGGAHNGNGGDISYHGIGRAGNEQVAPGEMDIRGDGTGNSGDFDSE
jgi:hypothetical protein